jgi:hypothetical protein
MTLLTMKSHMRCSVMSLLSTQSLLTAWRKSARHRWIQCKWPHQYCPPPGLLHRQWHRVLPLHDWTGKMQAYKIS